jgi:hypothetical protein
MTHTRLATLLVLGMIGSGLAGWLSTRKAAPTSTATSLTGNERFERLSRLRDDVNRTYGLDHNGTPRINCGPCGRFAVLFREKWQSRFQETLHVVFILSPDRSFCGHVMLKLPDGSYFDGGNGLLSQQQLAAMFPGYPLEEMVSFDRALVSARVGGLDQEHYPLCPNYSDALTAELIDKHIGVQPAQ